MGIVSNRESACDYDDDMRRARDAGIDAFGAILAPTSLPWLACHQLKSKEMNTFMSFLAADS
jgi:hypothetical protein